MTKTLHEHAVEVDTAIVEQYGVCFNANMDADRASDRVRYATRAQSMKVDPDHRSWNAQYAYYFVDHETKERALYSLELVREMLAAGKFPDYTAKDINARLAVLDEKVADAKAAYAELRVRTARYEGWSRFYLVQGGHIHSSMSCSTCNNGKEATRFMWLPSLSALTEREAVESQGAILCTVCFPTAPTEWTNGHDLDRLAKLAKRCPGSGEYSDQWGRHDTCGHCGYWTKVTNSGRFRAHNPRGAK